MQTTRIAGQVVEAVLSAGGIRVGTEEPHFVGGRPAGRPVRVRGIAGQ